MEGEEGMLWLLMDRAPAHLLAPTRRTGASVEIRQWLEQFAECVREVDYDCAAEMFACDVVGFGTFARMVIGRDHLVEEQWRKIWGCTRGFHFLLDEAHIEASGAMGWVASPWISQGRDETGNWYDRQGRCTLIFKRCDGKWLCAHSHFSRQPAPRKSDGMVTPA
jgi:ketosteroid isomerase-like protein